MQIDIRAEYFQIDMLDDSALAGTVNQIV